MSRILVVADEPGIAMAPEHNLKLEGYAVEVTGEFELAG